MRVALWRALHVLADPPPHVINDEVGLKLAAPDEGWRARPDMDPVFTKNFRASIVARARFIEDLVMDEAARGVDQYVLLGAGLDSFAQRRLGEMSNLKVFEVDQPGTQAWKKKRLVELGYGVPTNLKFAPVNFEKREDWVNGLETVGFDPKRPSVIASTGVTLYLTKEAVAATLRTVAAFAPGSTLAMTYLLPMEMATPEERPGREIAERGAKAGGTPFLSFFTPEGMTALALESGFKEAEAVTAEDLAQRYFSGRTDGLRTSGSEQILVART